VNSAVRPFADARTVTVVKCQQAAADMLVIRRTSSVKRLFIAIYLCVIPVAWGQQKTINQDGVAMTYDAQRYSKVEIVESKKEPLPHATDRLNVHPANLLFVFYERSRYAGSITVYPLEDRAVEDLRAAYPELPQRTAALMRLLHDRPVLPERYSDGAPKEIPTIQNQMSTQYFLSHERYLDFSWGSGVGFLVQYSQDASNYAVGARLRYEIEAISSSNKLAICAYFNVAHPDLPHTEENGLVTDERGQDLGEVDYLKYLRQMEKFLDSKSESTFQPSLRSIQALVNSLRFENVDAAGWGATFSGKKVIE